MWPLKLRFGWRLIRGIGVGAFCALVSACASASPVPAPAPLRLAATDLTAPLLNDLVTAYAQSTAGVTVVTATLPLATLNVQLINGQTPAGLAATHAPGQFATPLGYVSFVVIVHPANPLAALTAAQVREIFAGRLTDWAQVGGPGGAIQVVCREDAADAAQAFRAVALNGEAPTLTALVAPSWAAMRQAVNQTPGAIGYLPLPEMETVVKVVGIDEDWRVLIVALAAGEPSGPARDFLVWAQSAVGQQAVAQRYAPFK